VTLYIYLLFSLSTHILCFSELYLFFCLALLVQVTKLSTSNAWTCELPARPKQIGKKSWMEKRIWNKNFNSDNWIFLNIAYFYHIYELEISFFTFLDEKFCQLLFLNLTLYLWGGLFVDLRELCGTTFPYNHIYVFENIFMADMLKTTNTLFKGKWLEKCHNIVEMPYF